MRSSGYEPDQYKVYAEEDFVPGENETQGIVEIIVIFMATYVVGKIIDGVVIAITGRSTEEWVADALIWVANGLKDVVTMTASRYKIERAYNSSGCVQYRPRGPWVCPY